MWLTHYSPPKEKVKALGVGNFKDTYDLKFLKCSAVNLKPREETKEMHNKLRSKGI